MSNPAAATAAPDLTPFASRLVYLWDKMAEAKTQKGVQIASATVDGACEMLSLMGVGMSPFQVRMTISDAVEAAGPRKTYGTEAQQQRAALVADLTSRLENL